MTRPPEDARLRLIELDVASRYALLGMKAVALEQKGRGAVLAADAARRANLPLNMLAKVFQRLARLGLLVSKRGPGGGYSLARPAEKITLAEIISALRSSLPRDRCVLRRSPCTEGAPCLLHACIARADNAATRALESVSLEDFAGSE